MEETIGIETILVIPKRPDRFQYKINDGKLHMCDEDNLRKLIYPLIDKKQIVSFLDILSRLRIFAVVVNNPIGNLYELKLKDTTKIERETIGIELKNIKQSLTKRNRKKVKEEKNQILDAKMSNLFEKVL